MCARAIRDEPRPLVYPLYDVGGILLRPAFLFSRNKDPPGKYPEQNGTWSLAGFYGHQVRYFVQFEYTCSDIFFNR